MSLQARLEKAILAFNEACPEAHITGIALSQDNILAWMKETNPERRYDVKGDEKPAPAQRNREIALRLYWNNERIEVEPHGVQI